MLIGTNIWYKGEENLDIFFFLPTIIIPYDENGEEWV